MPTVDGTHGRLGIGQAGVDGATMASPSSSTAAMLRPVSPVAGASRALAARAGSSAAISSAGGGGRGATSFAAAAPRRQAETGGGLSASCLAGGGAEGCFAVDLNDLVSLVGPAGSPLRSSRARRYSTQASAGCGALEGILAPPRARPLKQVRRPNPS